MGIYTHDEPVNPAQVIEALGSIGCTVRDNGDGTHEVEVSEVSDETLATAVVGIIYEAPAAPVSIAAEFDSYKATMQQAIAQRDAVDAERDDWLLDLEFRLLDLEG